MREKKIKTALLSVYHKDGLADIVKKLDQLDVKIISTGGTHSFISGLGIKAEKVEDITSYPSILGGRVKTLHPKVFGGILARRDNESDMAQLSEYNIPEIDLVVVDLYPFSETVASGADEQDIIEKIDIGGISLIRAAAKNYRDTLIISHRGQYPFLLELLVKLFILLIEKMTDLFHDGDGVGCFNRVLSQVDQEVEKFINIGHVKISR